jgi:shikimate dehydrogenase
MPAHPFLPRELYGIIGHPLGHTMSPLLHNWGFGLLDIPAVYMAWPLEPGRVGDFVTAVRTLPIRGASVTIPHKQAVLPLLDGVSERARAVGAVNTLYWRDGRLLGENTDVTGFLAPLRQRASEGWRCARALVLGNGGAARAVLAGLNELGRTGDGVVGEVAVTGRNAEKAAPLAAEFGAGVVDWEARTAWGADLVVNTTPMGMSGERQGDTAFPAQGFSGRTGLAYDLVYNPLRTRFLSEAADAGWDTQDGLAMFVEQGREQFRLWTGLELPAEGARTLVAVALGLGDVAVGRVCGQCALPGLGKG